MGILITLGLSVFLWVGTSVNKAVMARPDHGAVRLSSLKNLPSQKQEEIFSAQDAPLPRVEKLEAMAPTDMAMDMASLDASMAVMEMEFTPHLAGTVPLGGVPAPAVPSPGTAPGGGALTLGEVDEYPRPLYAPAPLYPSSRRELGKTVRIQVRILLGKDGMVKKATPLNATPELAPFFQAARKTLMSWRFSPCTKGNKPVECLANQPFSFSISR